MATAFREPSWWCGYRYRIVDTHLWRDREAAVETCTTHVGASGAPNSAAGKEVLGDGRVLVPRARRWWPGDGVRTGLGMETEWLEREQSLLEPADTNFHALLSCPVSLPLSLAPLPCCPPQKRPFIPGPLPLMLLSQPSSAPHPLGEPLAGLGAVASESLPTVWTCAFEGWRPHPA